jgi:hypothetical protein
MKIGVEHDNGICEHVDSVFGLYFRFVTLDNCEARKDKQHVSPGWDAK